MTVPTVPTVPDPVSGSGRLTGKLPQGGAKGWRRRRQKVAQQRNRVPPTQRCKELSPNFCPCVQPHQAAGLGGGSPRRSTRTPLDGASNGPLALRRGNSAPLTLIGSVGSGWRSSSGRDLSFLRTLPVPRCSWQLPQQVRQPSPSDQGEGDVRRTGWAAAGWELCPSCTRLTIVRLDPL
jgi:hypothetical protein